MSLPIQILPYQSSWKVSYEQEMLNLLQALSDLQIFFYHIGSTSIPGCFAKPVIDILAVTSDVTCLDAFAKNLENLGYETLGEYGMKQRRYFRKQGSVHLHIFEDSDPEVERHLRFCSYLRLHPEEVANYSQLKKKLAEQFPLDIMQYCLGKDSYIKKIDICAANAGFGKLHLHKHGGKKKHWTQEEIVKAMTVNMHLQMTYFAKCTPTWEILFQPDVTVVRSQILDDTFNYVVSALFSEKTAQKRVQEIVSLYPKIPFSWWVGPLDTPTNLEEFLLQEGFSYKEENIGMYLDLTSFTSASSSKLTFTQVLTKKLLQDFCSVFVSIGGNPETYEKLYSKIPTSLYQEGYSLEMYIGYANGVPAVTGMLVLHAGCAGIYYVMTHPQMRNQGHGSAMMQHLLQRAKDLGYFLATLQASHEGKNLHTRLGFQEACLFKEYAIIQKL